MKEAHWLEPLVEECLATFELNLNTLSSPSATRPFDALAPSRAIFKS